MMRFQASQRARKLPVGYTAEAVFGTTDVDAINRLSEEEFLRLTGIRRRESEVAARRAKWEARTPTFKHDECSTAFPEDNFERNFSVHVSGHRLGNVGQQPTPVKLSSQYCPSKTACTDCQKWVRKVAEGTVSLETPGAGWVPSRDQVLRCAARVRAALPEITFGGVDLQVDDKLMGLTTGQAVGAVKHALRQCNAVGFAWAQMNAATYHSAFVPQFMAHLGLTDVNKVPARSTLDAVYRAHKRKERETDVAVEPAPPARSKRARRAPKKKED